MQQKAPQGIIFFSGYHGVGKTYTATALLEHFNAKIIDCGPVIRQLFYKSGFNSFSGWVESMKRKYGDRWDDECLLREIKNQIGTEEYLFIVGNRDIDTILFLANKIPHRFPAIILYLEKPTRVIKSGYELRTNSILSDEEFETILHAGPDSKLKTVKEYVINNPDNCSLIYEDHYGNATIEKAIESIKKICK